MERSWVEKLYQECGREVSLAYNTFNHTNNWGITLATGIVAIVFIAAIKSVEGQITIVYPNIAYWFVVIIAWVIMIRFFARSCLALVNMYRWNTIIYAASKLLSLPEGHAQAPIFERNLAKKLKAYFYDWRSPITLHKLLWECFRLMYIWFFLILFGLIMWGFVVLYGQTLWVVGLVLFLLPTTWEIYSLFTWRGFKYQPLNLETEPDIATLCLGENEAGPSPETITGKPRNGLLKRVVVSQALTYLFFGLLSILAFIISPSKSLPIISAYDIWNTVINIVKWSVIWALIPVGVAAISWALILFFVTFKWKVVEQLEESRFQRVQRWNQSLYWPALSTVFASSFVSIWASMAKAGGSEPFLLILFGLGIVVLLILFVHHVRSGR